MRIGSGTTGRRPSLVIAAILLVPTLIAACGGNSDTRKQAFVARGHAHFEKADYADAIIEYQNALKIDANLAEVRIRLSEAYLRTGDAGASLRQIVRAADLRPADAELQVRAGRMLAAAGQFEDAASRARRVLDTHPRHVDALSLLGTASAGLKDTDAARQTLELAVAQAPGEPSLHASLGTILRAQGNLQEAESAFRRALDASGRRPDAFAALAAFYASANKPDAAEATLREGLAQHEGSVELVRSLAVLLIMRGRDTEAEPFLARLVDGDRSDPLPALALSDIYIRARQYDKASQVLEPVTAQKLVAGAAIARLAFIDHAAGRAATAYGRLDSGLTKYPRAADLQAMRARLLLADRRFDEAAAEARAARDADPRRFEGPYVLGAALLELGRPDDAIAPLREAATLAPRAVGPKLQLGRYHLARGETAMALQFAREAVAVDPSSPLARVLLVRTYLAAGNATAARHEMTALLTALPNSPQVQSLLGHLEVLSRNPARAEAAFTRALELDVADVEAISGLVTTRLLQNRAADAARLASDHLARSPQNVDLLILAARAQLASGEGAEAEKRLKEAIAAAPSRLDAYELLGHYYVREKRLGDARAQFEAMARAQPKAVAPQTMVGILHQLEGDMGQARATYETLLQARPDAAVAANNLAMMYVQEAGNLDVALNYAQVAKKGLPIDADIADTLGLVYMAKGLGSLAVPEFELSTRLEPGRAEFWTHLGEAYEAVGEKTKARQAAERAAQLAAQTVARR